MVLDVEVGFALKNSMSQYETKNFSLFNIDKANESFPSLEINLTRKKEINLKVKCPLCGECHYYEYNVSELFKKDMLMGGCETLGVPLLFIGNKHKVHQRIEKFNEINKNIWAMI